MENLVKKLPGIGLCLLIAVPAWFTVQWIEPLEVMGAPVLAILAGMLLTLAIPVPERAKSGIAFVSKKVLQAAVVLLGFGLNLSTVGEDRRSLSADLPFHHCHLVDHGLCPAESDTYSGQDGNAGGCGLLHLRRIGHRGHRTGDRSRR